MIVCIGWGSLIWCQKTLPVLGGWRTDGPELQVEFARESRDKRITLVLCDAAPAATVLWTVLDVPTLDDAKKALAEREGITAKNVRHSIGYWSNAGSSPHSGADVIAAWAETRKADGIVWTALKPKMGGDYRVPAVEEVIGHLKGLTGTTLEAAEEYVPLAPRQIATPYLDPQRDFRSQYEAYLNRRMSAPRTERLRAEELLTTEIEKFELVRDTIRSWLASSGGRCEAEWQKQLLAFLPIIFPKYVAVIEKVPIEDRYTRPGRLTHREIDLALVDVNGNIDVIEIKRPMDDVLLRRTKYRDNFVPTGDLSGTIMQAEKYLLHLAKGGVASEDKLTEKYKDVLPPGLRIRITNPKALLILGRDRKPDGNPALTAEQLFDLEVIKRKYANMIDIITYDDLTLRLDNIISSLKRRRDDGLDATAG